MASYTLSGNITDLVGDVLASPNGAAARAYLIPSSVLTVEGTETRVGSVELDLDSLGFFSQPDIPAGGYQLQVVFWDAASKQTRTVSTQAFGLTEDATLEGVIDKAPYVAAIGSLSIGTVTTGPIPDVDLHDGVLDFVIPEGGVTSVNGATGAVAVPSVLDSYVGQINGQPSPPWQLTPVRGVELWRLSNMNGTLGQNSTLTPSITGNGTSQNLRTFIDLGSLNGGGAAFRVSLNVVNASLNGWWQLSIAVCGTGGGVLPNSNRQTILNGDSISGTGVNLPVEFDFTANPVWATGSTLLEIHLGTLNNSTSGTLSINNVSVQAITQEQRPMLFGFPGGGSAQAIHVPLFDPVTQSWRMAVSRFGADGSITNAIANIEGYNTDRPFQTDGPDPDFVATTLGELGQIKTSVILGAGQVMRQLRVTNNDQILNVRKADGTYELRGNTHGGETTRSGAANNWFEYDARGNGTWATWDGTGTLPRTCRRFRHTYNTAMQRSDAGSPFANVDHVCNYYPDGMMRMDRTTTFLADQRVGTHFEWMSSHDTSTPLLGRLGNGILVEGEVDYFPHPNTPAAPGVAGSTTGGTIPAGTYVYAVTALASGGETNASPTTSVTNTGSTSSNALTWSAVTGATGYRIYRGASLANLSLIKTVTGTSYTDTNADPVTGVQPPYVNRARQLEAASTASDQAVSDSAAWAVYYDPINNLCFGNIFDRDAVFLRANVASASVRLQAVPGIVKSYINIFPVPDGGNPDTGENAGVPTRLVTSGTTWTATHWAFTYVPANRDQYHLEIAGRATDLSRLKAFYPAT